MYFLTLLFFVLIVFSTFFFASGFAIYFDLPTFIILITLFIPMMMASGLMKPFLNAFKIVSSSKKEYNLVDLKQSYLGVSLAIKLIISSGLLLTIIGTIAILANLSEPSKLGPSFAVSIISVLYTLLTIIILLPIQYKLKAIIDSNYEQ